MFLKPAEHLGVGVNFRSEIAGDLIKNINYIDFVEINTERFFLNKNNPHIAKITQLVPVVLHGLTLSIGTDPIDCEYMDNLTHTLNYVDCAWFSEHIAATNVNGMETRSLMPVTLNDQSIECIVTKAKKIKNLTKKPFLLENITYYYSMPNNQLEEPYFIKEIIEKADCGLLLDLNNLYVNSINHCYDPYDFLKKIPLERVVEVHLAGCDYRHNLAIDTHASHTKQEVLSLFDFLCRNAFINGVVIERDANLDKFSDLLNEVCLVRDIMKNNGLIRR